MREVSIFKAFSMSRGVKAVGRVKVLLQDLTPDVPGQEVLMKIAANKQALHPHIMRQKGICGGRSIIIGTRIPVWSIIKWYKLGMPVEDIIREFPQLAPSEIHDAFSYYYDNLDEIERDIIKNEDEDNFRAIAK